MLSKFLSENRTELIERCRAKVAERIAPKATDAELQFGVPLFLEQLVKTLELVKVAEPAEIRAVSGSASGGKTNSSEIGNAAAKHGRELWEHGFTVDQLVHDYGDVCQSITDLAVERNEPFAIDEFRTLNRCLDNAIADSVTEFSYQNDLRHGRHETTALNENLGFFAHELRNLLNSAILALTAIKGGKVGLTGATGAVLEASLIGLRNLIDSSLTQVRLAAGMPTHLQLFSLARFIEEVRVAASLQAEAEGFQLVVAAVDAQLALDADRDLILAAVGNLLQNAFKFTRPHTVIRLRAYASGNRIMIEVEDQCGGLPPGDAEAMFEPFTQNGEDKSGLGLGLTIARRSVEANGGVLAVRDVPGSGCVFTIDLPRFSVPAMEEHSRRRPAA